MWCQCVLWYQPSVLDVTAYSGEEFDWGDLENAQGTDDMDVVEGSVGLLTNFPILGDFFECFCHSIKVTSYHINSP